jgi:hypothetical protein
MCILHTYTVEYISCVYTGGAEITENGCLRNANKIQFFETKILNHVSSIAERRVHMFLAVTINNQISSEAVRCMTFSTRFILSGL